jgi:hypothetical protein
MFEEILTGEAMSTVEAKGARTPGKGRETEGAAQEMEMHTQGGGVRTGTLTLPFATVQWRLPEFPMPVGRQELEAAVHKVREVLPPPTQLAYYAGLGVLAVFEVIEWPMVVVAAAGMIVVQRTVRRQDEHGKESDATASEKPAKPVKPAE